MSIVSNPFFHEGTKTDHNERICGLQNAEAADGCVAVTGEGAEWLSIRTGTFCGFFSARAGTLGRVHVDTPLVDPRLLVTVSRFMELRKTWYAVVTMGIQNFLLKQVAKQKLKDMPEGQREQMLAMIEKNPELFKKIGEEIDRRVKKGGEPQMKATMEVMKKYREELQSLMQN